MVHAAWAEKPVGVSVLFLPVFSLIKIGNSIQSIAFFFSFMIYTITCLRKLNVNISPRVLHLNPDIYLI
jgi:hypothetical protein